MKYYITEDDGLFELRQTRFRGRMKEHPHDVCGVHTSLEGIRGMAELMSVKEEDIPKLEVIPLPKGFKRVDELL